ncbi:hypothetical protein QP166_18480 [Sphingomonas sp. LR60]|uniref:hypothetical protein n=1 Tax=Sphingomonas sp. LR60 TaxID=3050233 RepID=UPI002FDF308B
MTARALAATALLTFACLAAGAAAAQSAAGRVSSSSAGKVGERRERAGVNGSVAAAQRIDFRIKNRVDSRINTRIDRVNGMQGDAIVAKVAADRALQRATQQQLPAPGDQD